MHRSVFVFPDSLSDASDSSSRLDEVRSQSEIVSSGFVHSFALVGFHDFPAGLALDVTAANVLAIASLQDLFRFRDVTATAAEVLAALVTRTAAIAMPKHER